MLFKMVLIQHLYGIPSLRKTAEEVKMNIAYRWFCSYLFNGQTPHFSTLGLCEKISVNSKTVIKVIY